MTFFPISGAHLQVPALVAIGFIVGIAGGFFGVGGSFLAGPALFWMGLPMNYVIGTDLTHLVGKSLVAVRRHVSLGQVDVKLALLMMTGTLPGVEVGARLIERLKREGNLAHIVSHVFAAALVFISLFMAWEVWSTLHSRRRGSPLQGLAKRVVALPIPPFVRLPKSGIERASFWAIFLVSLASGIFSGFLGGGAGHIRMPSLVYLLGVPTHIAVGTDLLEVAVSASYGSFSHALKGNVDILIALTMHTGAAVGAQIGAFLTQYVKAVGIRLAFLPLPLIGAYLLLTKQ